MWINLNHIHPFNWNSPLISLSLLLEDASKNNFDCYTLAVSWQILQTGSHTRVRTRSKNSQIILKILNLFIIWFRIIPITIYHDLDLEAGYWITLFWMYIYIYNTTQWFELSKFRWHPLKTSWFQEITNQVLSLKTAFWVSPEKNLHRNPD